MPHHYLCLFFSSTSLHMLFEGVPKDLNCLLQSLILRSDLEKKDILTTLHVPSKANTHWT